MLNRIFVREQCDEEYSVVNNRFKIGVTGMESAVGKSFIATSLAKELSRDKEKHIAYVEISGTNKLTFLYDSLGMDKRFAGRVFYDFYSEIAEGRSIAGLINLDERINWALCVPQNNKKIKEKKLEAIEFCRLINNVTADIIICDISQCDGFEQILKEMDVIIFVIDPLPSKLIAAYDQLCLMKKGQLEGRNTIWVVNKYNDGINKREFYDFIRIKRFVKVPVVLQEQIYLAEYNCKLPYSLKLIAESLAQPIRQIIQLLNI
ncbi:MAG: hypothetical protein AB9836_00395 [Aminipila sp.]